MGSYFGNLRVIHVSYCFRYSFSGVCVRHNAHCIVVALNLYLKNFWRQRSVAVGTCINYYNLQYLMK